MENALVGNTQLIPVGARCGLSAFVVPNGSGRRDGNCARGRVYESYTRALYIHRV